MSDDDIDATKAPLIEHLTELRQRLIRCVLAFVVCMILSFTVWEPIFDFLTDPICRALDDRQQQCGLILIKLQEGFFVAVRISVMGGLMLSFPYIAFQLWRFVAPGLYRTEKRAFLPFMIASPFMFFLGAGFLDRSGEVTEPVSRDSLFEGGSDAVQQAAGIGAGSELASGTPPTVPGESAGSTGDVAAGDSTGFGWPSLPGGALPAAGVTFQGSVAEYLTLTIKFILAFGICFQLPVLLTLMGKAGLVSAASLARVRKYAVVGILVLSAVVTPPDVITQVILFVVVYGLYEVSIWLVRRVETRLEKKLKEQGLDFDSDESDGGRGEGEDGKVSA